MQRFLQYLLISFILGLFIVFMVITAESLAPGEKFLIISVVMTQHIVAILWFLTLQVEVRKLLEYIVGGIHYQGPVRNRGTPDRSTTVLERVSFFPSQACKLRIISINVKSLRKYFNFIKFLHKGHSREYIVRMSFDPVRSQGRSEHAMDGNVLQLNRFGVYKPVVCGSVNEQRLYYFYSRAPSEEHNESYCADRFGIP